MNEKRARITDRDLCMNVELVPTTASLKPFQLSLVSAVLQQ